MAIKLTCAYFLLMLLSACSSTEKSIATNGYGNSPTSDYKTELKVPFETEDLIKIDTHIYDEPAYGVGIKYDHKLLSNDNISVFVYPVNSMFWDDHVETTTREMATVLNDMNLAVKNGIYREATSISSSKYQVEANQLLYLGRKSEFLIKDRYDNQRYSVAYIFIAEDKFVKFRITLESELLTSFNPDSIVNSILPKITVPKESAYMQSKREAHMKAMTLEFIEYLKQSSEQDTRKN